ncbi:MAG: hypothetical protein AB9891_11060 [Anaerolineaceae bacterium]
MGSGKWSTNVYDEHRRYKAASGKSTFDFSDTLHRSGRNAWHVHETLDPLGVKFRESRDSDEHPNSTAIAVIFDVTGSMLSVPVTLQKKLPQLLGLLMRKNYVSDPQILFGAIGDATCDAIPLQVGQFESDNRMDDNLENIFLEGGGGGQQTESYELAMYFMARHTSIDCWEKHGRKGYLFLIGDEMAYPAVNRGEVGGLINDGLERDIPLAEMVREARQRYDVFYLLPKAASYGGDPKILKFWRELLGQNVLELEDSETVCETIALAIGMMEGTIDLVRGIDDLREFKIAPAVLKTVEKALAGLPAGMITARACRGSLPGLLAKVLPKGV